MALSSLLPLAAHAQGTADSARAASVSDYRSQGRILEFADFLWSMEEYDRAIGEYQRYQFVRGDSVPSIMLRIAQCHFRLERYRDSALPFAEAARLSSRPALRDSALIGYANALYRANESVAFRLLADSVSADTALSGIHGHMAALGTLGLLQQCRWDEAEAIATSFVAASSDSGVAPLAELARQGQQLPHKSPALAAVLSALVPGSGKVYCGQTFDGIYSFVVVGGCAWLAYEGFRDHGISSGKGWVFGSAALVFYGGNIYGSGIAARMYNRGHTERLLDEVQIQVDYWTRF